MTAAITLSVPLGLSAPPANDYLGSVLAKEAVFRGDTRVAGHPLALAQRDLDGAEIDASFWIHAKRLTVQSAVQQSKHVGYAEKVDDAHLEAFNASDAVVVAGSPRPLHMFSLFASDDETSFQLMTMGGMMAPAQAGSVQEERPFPSDLPLIAADTARGVRWTDGSSLAHVQIRGSFVVSLWEWDATVRSATGTTPVHSGVSDEPLAADPTGMSTSVAADRTKRQVHLIVEDGQFDADWFSPKRTEFYFQGSSTSVDGSVILNGLSGDLADGSALRSSTSDSVSLEGILNLVAGPSADGRIPFELTGVVQSANMDGQAAQWVAPVDSKRGLPGWLGFLAIGAVLAPGAMYGGVHARRWQQSARMQRLEDGMSLGQYQEVARGADGLLGSKDFGRDAAVLKVEALTRLGKLDEALSFLRSSGRWTGPSAAMQEFLIAYIHVLRNDPEEAVPHLERCLAAAPELRDEVRRAPTFAAIRKDPRISILLSVGTTDDSYQGAYA